MWVYLKYRGGPSQEQTCLKSVVSDIRRYLFNLQFISKVLARVGFLFSFFKKSAQEMSTLTRILFSYLHSSDFLLLLLFQKKIINQGSSLASMASMHSIYCKVHTFWEGHKILRNLHLTFDYSQYIQSKIGWRFRKILWPSQNIWALHIRTVSF